MPVAARADVFFDIQVPGDMAAQMRADVGEDDDIGFVFANGKYPVAGDRVLPAVHPLSGKAEKSGDPDWDILKRA